jgi:hypothetical protein
MGWITLEDAVVVLTRDAAVKVDVRGSEHWIPRSQIMDGDMLEEGDDEIVISEWIAKTKEIA